MFMDRQTIITDCGLERSEWFFAVFARWKTPADQGSKFKVQHSPPHLERWTWNLEPSGDGRHDERSRL